jgi:starch-binding outer membrane protein, SusD/RagB family
MRLSAIAARSARTLSAISYQLSVAGIARLRRACGIAALAAGAAAASACNEVTVPSLNNPIIESLTENPNIGTVNTATVGLLITLRDRVPTEASAMGILGKESYNLDQAEPRNVISYLQGPIEPGGFVQDLGWTGGYRNIVQGVTILEAVDKIAETPTPSTVSYSLQQKEGIRGFVKTVMAMELLTQVRVRDAVGIVVDVSADRSAPLGAIVSKADALTRIVALLDEAKTHLQNGGTAFAFPIHTGFAGFATPATFLQVNRAIKARAEVYRQQWASVLTALNESFIDATTATAANLARGAYHVYSTTSGDLINPLFDQTPTRFYVHPSILNGAQLRANGQPDLRLTQKTAVGTGRTTVTVQGTHKFMNYPTNTSSVPIIKNEELILLRAEARYQSGDIAGALADINFIRVNSGGLAPLVGFADATAFVDELLYNRTYSLLFEGGHRWVDYRRYGRLAQLPKINTQISEKTFPYVMLPADECNQRNPQPQPGCSQVAGQ